MSLQVVEQSNALIVPLEIRLEGLAKLEQVVQKLRGLDRNLPKDTKNSWDDATVEKTFESLLKKHIGTGAASGAQNAASLFRNPQGFMLSLMMNPYVAAALMAAGFGKLLLDIMMQPGGIFDTHFRRDILAERIIGRRRDSRQRIRTGQGEQVIISDGPGSTDVESSVNTYRQVRDGTIRSNDAFQIRTGYRF